MYDKKLLVLLGFILTLLVFYLFDGNQFIKGQALKTNNILYKYGILQQVNTDKATSRQDRQETFHFNRHFPGYSSLSNEYKVSLNISQEILTTIRENCRKKGISTEWNLRKNFSKPRLLIAKTEYHILYGSNPKTGSTSFKKFLYHLDGDFVSRNFHKYSGGHYETVENSTFFANEQNFDDYVKILSIRNPITRLISAFRDKQLRENLLFKVEGNMTDSEQFVKLIKMMKIEHKVHNNDAHFMPQWQQMDICRFPYDVVIQFEDAKRYTNLVQHLTKTTKVEFSGSRVETGKDARDTMYYVNEYWGALTDKQKSFVYKTYSMDFQILGYSKVEDPLFSLLNYQNSL